MISPLTELPPVPPERPGGAPARGRSVALPGDRALLCTVLRHGAPAVAAAYGCHLNVVQARLSRAGLTTNCRVALVNQIVLARGGICLPWMARFLPSGQNPVPDPGGMPDLIHPFWIRRIASTLRLVETWHTEYGRFADFGRYFAPLEVAPSESEWLAIASSVSSAQCTLRRRKGEEEVL